MTLYEIKDTYQSFLEQIEAGEVPEEAINDTLAAIEGDFDDKADNIACIIKNLKAEAEAIKAEEEMLQARRKRKLLQVEKLTQYLQQNMEEMNRPKIETPRNALSLRKNPPSLQIENERGLIDYLAVNQADLLVFQPPKVDKAKLKVFLSSQDTPQVPYVKVVQGYALRMK